MSKLTTENVNTMIICAKEETLGKELFQITIPENKTYEEIDADLKMATLYANMTELSEKEDEAYDEYFDEMAAFIVHNNGMYTFQHYLTLKGYKCEDLTPDYEFEW